MKTPLRLARCACLATALTLSACGSAPLLPNDALQAADIAIATADTEKAAEFAPVELKAARDHLGQARVALAKDPTEADVINARRLADAAQADAELASARARNARATAVNVELQKNIDTLREELRRSGGAAS
ncbi:DUF4398 domain-containing protein [uncultured Nevskia sp.]|uniref:DUF4398 domain-containing protein n=1 Tax=uncultured Nevskia sp. TaxID=228950 RepID=UPI0025D473A8|nr:DUF4398 domain-containing protein [uncultured Nevskia sp.]